MADFSEQVFGIGSLDRVHLRGDRFPDGTDLGAPVVELTVDVGDEDLTIALDDYHLKELIGALRRGLKWVDTQTPGVPQ